MPRPPLAVRQAAMSAWLALLLAATTPTRAADALPDLMPALQLAGDAAAGQKAFEACIRCHRRDASGRQNGTVPRLSGQHAQVIVKQVADIRSGLRANPAMKPFADAHSLTPQGLADIAAHLQALPMAGAIGKGQARAVERGQTLYTRDCVACHGARGEGRADAFVPMLAGQHHGYLVNELGLIRDGGRGNSNPAMVQVVKAMDAADFEALADYIAQLPLPGTGAGVGKP